MMCDCVFTGYVRLLLRVMVCLQVTGMTPLMYAVKDNRTSFVDRLIELGCDVTARNNVGTFLLLLHR